MEPAVQGPRCLARRARRLPCTDLSFKSSLCLAQLCMHGRACAANTVHGCIRACMCLRLCVVHLYYKSCGWLHGFGLILWDGARIRAQHRPLHRSHPALNQLFVFIVCDTHEPHEVQEDCVHDDSEEVRGRFVTTEALSEAGHPAGDRAPCSRTASWNCCRRGVRRSSPQGGGVPGRGEGSWRKRLIRSESPTSSD